jgi:hypothetical protein
MSQLGIVETLVACSTCNAPINERCVYVYGPRKGEARSCHDARLCAASKHPGYDAY